MKKFIQSTAKQINKEFLEKTNSEYQILMQNKKMYTEYMQEMQDWDITLQDGLNAN